MAAQGGCFVGAVNYGSASGPAALSKDGGRGEAAAGRGTCGRFRGQRPVVRVSGGGGGRERGGFPTAGRRDGDAARRPAEGAGDAARGAHRLPGALLREHGPALAGQRRRRGAARPAPPAAAAPGPRAVAPSPGSPLAEDRFQQQRERGLRVSERQRPQEEAWAGRAHIQRAAEARVQRRRGARGGGGTSSAQDPVPGPRGCAAGYLPGRHVVMLCAAGVCGARGRPLPAAGGPGPGGGRSACGPGRAGHAGGRAGHGRPGGGAHTLPRGRFPLGPRQSGTCPGQGGGWTAAQRTHVPRRVPGEGCRPLHRQGQAGGLSPGHTHTPPPPREGVDLGSANRCPDNLHRALPQGGGPGWTLQDQHLQLSPPCTGLSSLLTEIKSEKSQPCWSPVCSSLAIARHCRSLPTQGPSGSPKKMRGYWEDFPKDNISLLMSELVTSLDRQPPNHETETNYECSPLAWF